MGQLVSEQQRRAAFRRAPSAFSGMALVCLSWACMRCCYRSVQKNGIGSGWHSEHRKQRDAFRAKQGAQTCFFRNIAGFRRGAWGLTRLMTSLLFEVKPTDAPTSLQSLSYLRGSSGSGYAPARRGDARRSHGGAAL